MKHFHKSFFQMIIVYELCFQKFEQSYSELWLFQEIQNFLQKSTKSNSVIFTSFGQFEQAKK